MLVCSPLLTSHKWRELVSSGRLVCRCHDVYLWCYVCFVLLRFRLDVFVEAAALRSIVLRYAGVPLATRFFPFLFIWRCRLFRVFFVPSLPFSLCLESTSYVFFHSEWCFSTLGPQAGFSTSAYLCENSAINQSNKRLVLVHTRAFISVRIASNHYHEEKTHNASLIACTPVVLQVLSTSRTAMYHSEGRQCSLTTRPKMEVRR